MRKLIFSTFIFIMTISLFEFILEGEVQAQNIPQACLFDAVSIGQGPSIQEIKHPSNLQVIQRVDASADVKIELTVTDSTDCLWVNVIDLIAEEEIVPWQVLQVKSMSSNQSTEAILNLPEGGWYRLEIRAAKDMKLGAGKVVEYLGIGDVYVTAGQSNASFAGESPHSTQTGFVSFFDGNNWVFCQDPLISVDPAALGGSPWCHLGDFLYLSLDVPIAIVPLAWSGSSLSQWQEGAADSPIAPGYLHQRINERISSFGPNGIKAVLWHQGESELTLRTTVEDHANMLNTLIASTRNSAQFNIPWLISEASFAAPDSEIAPYICYDLPAGMDCSTYILIHRIRVLEGQRAVFQNDPYSYLGVQTDEIGAEYRYDGSHFNRTALEVVGAMWYSRIMSIFF